MHKVKRYTGAFIQVFNHVQPQPSPSPINPLLNASMFASL